VRVVELPADAWYRPGEEPRPAVDAAALRARDAATARALRAYLETTRREVPRSTLRLDV
jgi:hypothetical protein